MRWGGRWGRGIGLGTYVESQSGSPEEQAVARVLPQGVIEVEIGTLSSGQGHETSYAQLLGEWLGVENERIRLVTGDSDRTKFGAGSHSGRSIRLASISMHAASQRIIEQGLQIASHLLEATAEDIDFTDGRFTIEGTDRAADLFTVAAAAEGDARVPEALRGPLVGTGDVVSRISSFPHGWHVAEVEVDPETGLVELACYTAIDDVGRAVGHSRDVRTTKRSVRKGLCSRWSKSLRAIAMPISAAPLAIASTRPVPHPV
jgi:aerobic carbon-monoxide dehydrogenase large subunit